MPAKPCTHRLLLLVAAIGRSVPTILAQPNTFGTVSGQVVSAATEAPMADLTVYLF